MIQNPPSIFGPEDLTTVNREDQDYEEDYGFEIVRDEYEDNEESSSDMDEDHLEEEANKLDNYSNDEIDESDDDDLWTDFVYVPLISLKQFWIGMPLFYLSLLLISNVVSFLSNVGSNVQS